MEIWLRSMVTTHGPLFLPVSRLALEACLPLGRESLLAWMTGVGSPTHGVERKGRNECGWHMVVHTIESFLVVKEITLGTDVAVRSVLKGIRPKREHAQLSHSHHSIFERGCCSRNSKSPTTVPDFDLALAAAVTVIASVYWVSLLASIEVPEESR